MAQEEIKYTIANDGQGNAGSQVDLIVTFDPSSQNPDGYFTATDASGTYDILDASGNIVRTDHIQGLAAPGQLGNNDNEFSAGANSYVDQSGITFIIDNVADGNDVSAADGQVNFFYGGTTYMEDGSNHSVATDVTANPVVCFVSGTRIRTARGDIAVEDLVVGELVVTASGTERPIQWIGHRGVNCHRHPRPHEANPICISANAFGPNKPVRDLLVSPGHSICVEVLEQVLIPAVALVNGMTIRQIEVPSIVYWHIELGSHDILLAENLPAESYLEMSNRDFFSEERRVSLLARPDTHVITHADFCRPFHSRGPFVEIVNTMLRTRALAISKAARQQECLAS